MLALHHRPVGGRDALGLLDGVLEGPRGHRVRGGHAAVLMYPSWGMLAVGPVHCWRTICAPAETSACERNGSTALIASTW